MTSIYVFMCFGIILCLGSVSAQADEDHIKFRAFAKPLFEECGKELGVDMTTEKDKLKNEELKKCVVACFLTKFGILKNGMIDEKECVQKLTTFIRRADKLEKYIVQVKVCSKSANEHEVTDGDKGCERTGFFIDCLHEGLDDSLIVPKE